MEFNTNNFGFKELVNTFEYTTATQNRDVCKEKDIGQEKRAQLRQTKIISMYYLLECLSSILVIQK